VKQICASVISIYLIFIVSCNYDSVPSVNENIPNGDFENWDAALRLLNWKTNSCPECVQSHETYIVQRESNYVYHGRYAALFIYNYANPAWAENKFSISFHPLSLVGYVRCNNVGSDSVYIKIKLYRNLAVVDSGSWIGTSSIPNYELVTIPITQNATKVDAALIRIQGGNRNSLANTTSFWVDDLKLN
jgi:hypothetical protein